MRLKHTNTQVQLCETQTLQPTVWFISLSITFELWVVRLHYTQLHRMTWNNLPLHHSFTTAQSKIIIGASAWSVKIYENKRANGSYYRIYPHMPSYEQRTTKPSTMLATNSTQIETNKCISNQIENCHHTQFSGQMYILCVKVISIMLNLKLFVCILLLLLSFSLSIYLIICFSYGLAVERFIGTQCVWIWANGFCMIRKCTDILLCFFFFYFNYGI